MTRYQINIGITVFGTSTNPLWPDAQIQEFKEFVETNSKFNLNLIINKYPDLQNSEISYWKDSNPPCYFLGWWTMSAESLARIPKNVQSNLVLYNYKGLTPMCMKGGTYGGDVAPNGVPWVSLPFGYPDDPFPPWREHGGHDMVHEWLHALDSTFNQLGYPAFPSADECDQPPLNCTIEKCPGWITCYKSYLAGITDQMYSAIGKEVSSVSSCNNGVMIGETCVPTLYLIGGAVLFVFMMRR